MLRYMDRLFLNPAKQKFEDRLEIRGTSYIIFYHSRRDVDIEVKFLSHT